MIALRTPQFDPGSEIKTPPLRLKQTQHHHCKHYEEERQE